MHGGSAPQVRDAANRRLLAMVLPALVRLEVIMRKPETSDADRLRAIVEVLNRTGFSGKTTIEVEAGDSLKELVNSVIAEVPVGWDPAYTFEPDPDYQPAGEIVDAELVEEERPAPAAPAPIPSSSRVPARIAERLGKGRR